MVQHLLRLPAWFSQFPAPRSDATTQEYMNLHANAPSLSRIRPCCAKFVFPWLAATCSHCGQPQTCLPLFFISLFLVCARMNSQRPVEKAGIKKCTQGSSTHSPSSRVRMRPFVYISQGAQIERWTVSARLCKSLLEKGSFGEKSGLTRFFWNMFGVSKSEPTEFYSKTNNPIYSMSSQQMKDEWIFSISSFLCDSSAYRASQTLHQQSSHFAIRNELLFQCNCQQKGHQWLVIIPLHLDPQIHVYFH